MILLAIAIQPTMFTGKGEKHFLVSQAFFKKIINPTN
jgi:hypothetical protein